MTESEFIQSYRGHYGRIYRFCLVRTGSRADAEEIAAEVFARLLARGTAAEPASAAPWLFTVARNLCVDRARRLARVHPQPPEALPIAAHDDGERSDVWEAVRRLTPDEQLVICLRVLEDLTFAEIGRTLRRSEGAVKMAFHRSMRKLAVLLPEGETRERSIR